MDTTALTQASVKLIGNDGSNLGEMGMESAEAVAERENFDMVRVGHDGDTPVYRLMDLGREKYRKQQAKTHVRRTRTKEVQFGPNIAEHDLGYKSRHIDRFLEEGHRVKVILTTRRRQPHGAHTPERRLDDVLSRLSFPYSKETGFQQSGGHFSVLLAPGVKPKQ